MPRRGDKDRNDEDERNVGQIDQVIDHLARRRCRSRRQDAFEVRPDLPRGSKQPVGRTGGRRPVGRGRHLDDEARAAAHQFVDHRAVGQLEPARPPRLADDDAGDIAAAGKCQDLLDHRPAGHGDDFGAELAGQPHGLGKAGMLGVGETGMALGLDIERDQFGI